MPEGFDTFFYNINSENISSISQRQSELQEARAIELYELALCLAKPIKELKREGMNITEILTYISEYLVFPESIAHTSALDVNKHRLSHYFGFLSLTDRLSFVDFLVDFLLLCFRVCFLKAVLDPLEEGMAAHSSILAWRTPVHGVAKNWTQLSN